MPSARALLCLASAAAFGAMGIFGKLAYDEGASVGTLLATRFVLAAALFWLVVAGAAAGALDPLGTALGLFAAVVYSAYVLTSEPIAARIGPLALSTLVCTGAATTLTLGGVATGDLDLAGGTLVLLAVLAVRTPVRVAVIAPPAPSRAGA